MRRTDGRTDRQTDRQQTPSNSTDIDICIHQFYLLSLQYISMVICTSFGGNYVLSKEEGNRDPILSIARFGFVFERESERASREGFGLVSLFLCGLQIAMALNVWVSQLGWSATAKQPSPITFLDHPSGTATARAGFSFSSASNSKNAKNVGMGMGTGGLSGRSDGIGNGRVHTVTRSGLDTAGATVGQVTEVNKDTFWPIVNAAAAADKIVVLDMYTQWCGPCKVMAPKFEQLSEKYLDAVFLKLDCNQENKVLAKELGIRVVPTFKILKDAKVVKEVTGAKFDDLVLAIESTVRSI